MRSRTTWSSGAGTASRTTSVPATWSSSRLCPGTTTASSTSISCGSSSGRHRLNMGICDGRVVIVTGSGRGIGREHALAFAREGAKVVVNDLGGDMHGEGGSLSPAMEVVEEIKAMGGEAVADGENVADFAGAGRMVQRAIDTFGHLDTLVNNAGILRDRMLVNMEEGEWDAVIAVHLKGAFGPTRHAAAYWRDQAKAGTPLKARVVNTSSPSGIFGNAGQTNYGAAKAGVAAFTIICGLELGRYGVCTNGIGPIARP